MQFTMGLFSVPSIRGSLSSVWLLRVSGEDVCGLILAKFELHPDIAKPASKIAVNLILSFSIVVTLNLVHRGEPYKVDRHYED